MKTWTWDRKLAMGAIVGILLFFAFSILGCTAEQHREVINFAKENLPPVEFCLTHETYGQVCIGFNGKVYVRADVTPEQRKEIEAWAEKEMGAK